MVSDLLHSSEHIYSALSKIDVPEEVVTEEGIQSEGPSDSLYHRVRHPSSTVALDSENPFISAAFDDYQGPYYSSTFNSALLLDPVFDGVSAPVQLPYWDDNCLIGFDQLEMPVYTMEKAPWHWKLYVHALDVYDRIRHFFNKEKP